jgi:hypothetical protein
MTSEKRVRTLVFLLKILWCVQLVVVNNSLEIGLCPCVRGVCGCWSVGWLWYYVDCSLRTAHDDCNQSSEHCFIYMISEFIFACK